MRTNTKIFEEAADCFNSLGDYAKSFSEKNLKSIGATADMILATQYYWNGVLKYFNEFLRLVI